MKRPSGSRRIANLTQSVHLQLNSYALTAGAAGVGLFATTVPAEARIIYTPEHRTIRTHDILHLDLNHDGVGDFLISNHSFCTTDICGRTLRVLPAGSKNQVVGAKGIGGPFYAYALRRGERIGPRQLFSGKLMAASGTEYGSVGQWFNVSDRYLGLKFVIGGKLHYGWARLSVIVGGSTITAALSGFAYESIPGNPIRAGQTKSTNLTIATPNPVALRHSEPATLGTLAMGSSGLSIWRREESVANIR